MTESKPRQNQSAPKSGPEDEAYPIRIARDGTWWHEGRPIRRIELAKLFSTVLRRDEAGDYWLITPAERGRIAVEDLPFMAVAVEVREEEGRQALVFRTNLDHTVTAGPDHPIGVDQDAETGEPRPYIRVREGLDARISRPVFYELVERGEQRPAEDGVQIGIWSRGTWFTLGTFAEG